MLLLKAKQQQRRASKGATDTMRILTSRTIETGESDKIRYVPFVASDGRVGYRITRMSDGKTTFMFMNPSDHVDDSGRDMQPNVFVYMGTANDPNQDSPLHYYNLEFPDDPPFEEPTMECGVDTLCKEWPECNHVATVEQAASA